MVTTDKLNQLDAKCKTLTSDLENMTKKKSKYQHQYEKHSKMVQRLQNEKSQLEERQQELT